MGTRSVEIMYLIWFTLNNLHDCFRAEVIFRLLIFEISFVALFLFLKLAMHVSNVCVWAYVCVCVCVCVYMWCVLGACFCFCVCSFHSTGTHRCACCSCTGLFVSCTHSCVSCTFKHSDHTQQIHIPCSCNAISHIYIVYLSVYLLQCRPVYSYNLGIFCTSKLSAYENMKKKREKTPQMIINIFRHVLLFICFPVQNIPSSGFSVVHVQV